MRVIPFSSSDVARDESLALEYLMNEQAGLVLFDYSGSGYEGTVSAVEAQFWASPLGATFDGVDDRVSLSAASELAYDGSSGLTLEVWANTGDSADLDYYLSKHGWSMYADASEKVHFETRNAGNTAWDTDAISASVVRDAWRHIVGVYNAAAGTKQIYIDGAADGAAASKTDGACGATFTYPLRLGCYTATVAHFLLGTIGEARVYKRALSADEIARNYEITRARYGV